MNRASDFGYQPTYHCIACGSAEMNCCDGAGGPFRRPGVFGYGPDELAKFKASWPCHGFPDELNCVVAHFESNGDLVEVEAFDVGGNWLDSAEFDGPAMVALVADIQKNGYEALPGKAEDYRDV